jgi:hypothetical protein
MHDFFFFHVFIISPCKQKLPSHGGSCFFLKKIKVMFYSQKRNTFVLCGRKKVL